MTQEEYEAKVQSMPHELQKTFREAMEIPLAKRIVNRFMGVVLKAYAEGQRAAQKESHDGAYMHGAEDMLEALRTISSMGYDNMRKYFPDSYNSNVDGIRMIIQMNPGDILETVDKYMDDKLKEKDERAKSSVKAMADEIGIEKLCEIADEIRKQKASEEECLPF